MSRTQLPSTLVIAAATLCSFLHFAPESNAQPLTVTIGVPAPLTGTEATVGDSLVKGARVAAEQAKGISITLDVQDEACDPQAGVNATNKMVANKVTMVVGYYCSGATLPSVTILHRAHIPTIVAAASLPAITRQGYPEIFRVYPTSDARGPVTGDILADRLKAKTAAMIHDNTAVQKGSAEAVQKSFEKRGGKVLLFTAITPHSSDFGVTVAKIMSLKPDAVMIELYYTDAALLTKQLVAAGFDPVQIVEGDSLDPHFVEIVGDDIAKKVTYEGPPVTDQLPEAKGFIEAYQAKWGAAPDPYTVYQYDAMNVAIEVLKQANSTDPDKIIAALKSYKGTGLTGAIAFDSNGQLTGENAYRPMYYRGGKFVLNQ